MSIFIYKNCVYVEKCICKYRNKEIYFQNVLRLKKAMLLSYNNILVII